MRNIYRLFIVLILLSTTLTTLAIAGPTPSVGNIAINNITDTSVKISFDINQSNAKTVIHYGTSTNNLNRLSDWNNDTGWTREISINGLSPKTKYYFSVYVYNGDNANYFTKSSVLNFVTTGVADTPNTSNTTVPSITNINIGNINDTSAEITFTVNQSDADTIINYGTTTSLNKKSGWNNDTGTTRSIKLSSLSNKTKYYYSIYAYNGSDSSKSSHSSTDNFTTTDIMSDVAPNVSNIVVVDAKSSTANISFSVDQNGADTRIYYGITESMGTWSIWNNKTSSGRKIMLSGLLNDTKYNFSVYAYNGNNHNLYKSSNMLGFITNSSDPNPPPSGGDSPNIISTSPEKTKHTIGKESINFNISFDQIVNITWYLNSIKVQENNSVKSSYYLNNTPSVGTWNVTATGKNKNSSKSYSWIWIVDPEVSHTGNRVWDGTKGMSTTYTWNAYSFSGFYYNLDNNLSTEELTITNIQRTIAKGNIVYTTSPMEVNFEHSQFGKYQVIGFMADKYFAGYTTNSSISDKKDMSTIAGGVLQKILIDDDNKRTVSVGSTLMLQEGYVLKMKEVDIGAGKGQIWISLLKDGGEVDNTVISAGDDYIYSKKVGSIQDLPIIAIHFDSVFRGKETNAAFIKGLFQLSDTTNSIKSGDTYGMMDISEISSNKITMENGESVSISSGSTIDLMGNLKLIVADSSTLRFALSVERSGEFDVRGTVYPVVNQWTPMNFGLNINTVTGGTNIGFYYDLDEDIGTESLKIASISGSSIPEGKLLYYTSPQEVSFSYSGFGKYQVIGFMADKYFAGYTANTKPPNPSTSIGTINVMSQGQLHKILIDDEDKRTVSIGSTLTLKDGYVLKPTDIDMGARTMLLALLKDGSEVDSVPLSAGQTYVYTKKVGNVDDLPMIIVRFDSVFSGQEMQAAFIRGVFQISETATSLDVGDTYGNMEISSVSTSGINMSNHGSIGLSSGSTVNIMGDIKFKVADSSQVRFYPFVTATPNMVGNQLIIRAPSRAIAGDAIRINVTAGGVPIEGVTISLGPEIGPIGNNTNKDGVTNVTIPIKVKGTYNITATKLGYQKANKTIEIERYIVERLSINTPLTVDQFETLYIQITSNNTNISGATVVYDNTTIGTTNNNGIITYSLSLDGIHNITASKDGYVPITRDINVRAPYVEYIAKDISIIPNSISEGQNIIVKSNITNIGTKAGNESVELIVNGTVANNKTISIGPKETKEIDFTHKVSVPEGNYTVEILEQEGQLEVKKSWMTTILIVAIITLIGAIVIFFLTKEQGLDKLLTKLKKQM